MKLKSKLLGIVGGITCIAGLSILPASAQSVDVDATVFAGATGSLSPAVPLTGGSGTFSFSSTACLGASVAVNADGGDNDAEVGLCLIVSTGSYSNIACGTGNVTGTSTVTSTTVIVSLDGGENGSVNYSILFVAGVGVLTGTANDGDTTVGVVDIVPTGGNCVTGVTQFNAQGAAASVAAGA